MISVYKKNIITCEGSVPARRTGGKFAHQAKLRRAGVKVPYFFCLTKELYELAIRSIEDQIREELNSIDFDDVSSIEKASKNIHDLITGLSFPGRWAKQIHKLFKRHFGSEALVSVRASTVGKIAAESEDSLANPFAGMSESFLYVPQKQVIECIQQCWASGFSPESLIYRHSQGMDTFGFGVAVGIQLMANAQKSFVLFTCDPNTAAKDSVITAGYGLGEGVVQEKVGVDHFFYYEKKDKVDAKIAPKTEQLVFDAKNGSGLIAQPVNPDLQSKACLSEREVRSIVKLGKSIEKELGLPQDIEGCITEDGQIFILQSRPIALDYENQIVWSNANVTESFPGTTTALTFSFAQTFYRVIFYDLYRRMGVSDQELRANHNALGKMIGFLHGKIYYCLSHFYLLHKQSPLFPLFREHWENMIGLPSSFQTHSGHNLSQLVQKIKTNARFIYHVMRTIKDMFFHSRNLRKFHSWWETLIAPKRGADFSQDNPISIIRFYQDMWAQVGEQWGVTLTNDAYLIPTYGWTEALFKKWKLDTNPALLSNLLCGSEKLESVEIMLSAVGLGEAVAANKEAHQAFATVADDEELWQRIQNGQFGDGLKSRFADHIHNYGDRGLQELKLEAPSMRDEPAQLVGMVRGFAVQGLSIDDIQEKEAQVRAEADRELKKALRLHPLRYVVIRFMLSRLRLLISHRENSRYCRSELFGVSRRIFHRLARYLVDQGALADADYVYHLTVEELFGYFDGSGSKTDLQDLAEGRWAEFAHNQSIELPQNITTNGPIWENNLTSAAGSNPDDDIAPGQEGAMQGLGSSSGRITGRARVVLAPSTVKDIEPGTILVARETDPGWLFLMLRCSGMIVERGSMLSHTAITGRKFSIPTIVGLANAVTIIPDGALVEMDGSTGMVQVIEEGSEKKSDQVTQLSNPEREPVPR